MAAAYRRRPKFGKKEVFLPNFTLTLLRTPFLPPTYASFIVPLNLNKLDIKDYLYHAYGVNTLAVRSFVQQQKVTQDKPGAQRPAPRRWFRARSIKKMTVEMDKPFVWPDEPADLSPWDKETYDAARESQDKERDRYQPTFKNKASPERPAIAEQAQALLKGKERWKPHWEDVGEPMEVEKDVPLSS